MLNEMSLKISDNMTASDNFFATGTHPYFVVADQY